MRTCARNLVRRTDDVIAVVLDADIVIAWHQRRIPDLIAFFDLGTVHGNLAGSVYSNTQCTAARVTSVNDEIGLLASFDLLQAVAIGVQGRRISVHFTDLDAIRTTRYVHPVELDVDLMDTILRRHEPHRVRVHIDALDEAVILDAARRYKLKRYKSIDATRKINFPLPSSTINT